MSQVLAFKPAERHAVKARIALAGPAGSGKTYTGLALATALADGGKVAVIDTEKGSASLYADEFTFDVVELGPPFAPQRYVDLIHAAEQAGYAAILIDSLSHAWADEGGVLDIVDAEAARNRGNKFAGWKAGTPAQNSLVNAVVRSSIHIVCTMRSKTEYVQEEVDGRKQIRKVGMAPIQRDGIDYEFSVMGELDQSHKLIVTKSRFKAFQDAVVQSPGVDLGRAILTELRKGSVGPSVQGRSDGPMEDGPLSAKEAGAVQAERPTDALFGEPGVGDQAGSGSAAREGGDQTVGSEGNADGPERPATDIIASKGDWKKGLSAAQLASGRAKKATAATLQKLAIVAANLGWDDDERRRQAGVDSFKDLTQDEAGYLIERWEAYEKSRPGAAQGGGEGRIGAAPSPPSPTLITTEQQEDLLSKYGTARAVREAYENEIGRDWPGGAHVTAEEADRLLTGGLA